MTDRVTHPEYDVILVGSGTCGAQINTMRELLKKGRYRQSKAVSPGGTYQARRGS